MTHWTGNRRCAASRSPAISIPSRRSRKVPPVHHGIRSERSTTLSPVSAEIGIATSSWTPSRAQRSARAVSISWNRVSSKSTRSILLTANTMWGMPSVAEMYVCRRVCSITPLRASRSTTATSAVEAPVTMFRVYWTCPGASASWNRRVGVTNERYATSIVIPCSRSARRPSVSRARFTYPSPRRSLVASTCSSWSAITCFESKSSRPSRVDLPSSTEPHVTRRRSSVPSAMNGLVLEVADTLPVLHRGLREAVIGARLAPLGDPRRRDLADDLVDRRCVRADTAGARHVAYGAEADEVGERLLVRIALDELRGRIEHPVPLEHLSLVREVDLRELEPLASDVLPHVELGPVRDREHAHLLALADPAVVEVPELRALGARVPLAEVVAEGEDPLLRARALLVAPRAADRGVEAVLEHRVEQRGRLQPVPGRARAGLVDHASLVDRLLDGRDHEPLTELRDPPVAELDRLGEVVARVDVHQREREPSRAEGLLGEAEQDDRVLAAGKEQHGS